MTAVENILTWMGVIIAALSIILLCVIITSAIIRITSKLQLSLPKKKVVITKKEIKKKRRTENMSQAKEGVTFNDIFMFMIAVPLVLLWVGFAGFVIHSGLQDDSVLEQIEGYTTLIAILGGPALLIIKDALDVWKQEQAEKTAFYKVKAQAVIDYNDQAQKQAQMIEAKAQEQEHKIETGTTLPKKK
jgi:sterol desaturase/sphingolipid hydroxylase (fatty acid hydroxylase superfamily)